jgi:hypothetical protein
MACYLSLLEAAFFLRIFFGPAFSGRSNRDDAT